MPEEILMDLVNPAPDQNSINSLGDGSPQAGAQLRTSLLNELHAALHGTQRLAVIFNAPYAEIVRASVYLLNHRYSNAEVVVLKGPLSVAPEMDQKAFGAPAALVRSCGLEMPESGVLVLGKAEQSAIPAFAEKIYSLRSSIGVAVEQGRAFEAVRFQKLAPLDMKSFSVQVPHDDGTREPFTVYRNFHLHGLRVQDLKGEQYDVQTYNNAVILQEGVEILGVSKRTEAIWRAVMESARVLVIGDQSHFADAMFDGISYRAFGRDDFSILAPLNDPANYGISPEDALALTRGLD